MSLQTKRVDQLVVRQDHQRLQPVACARRLERRHGIGDRSELRRHRHGLGHRQLDSRTVADAARVFNVLAGYDPADPYTEAGRGRREEDYTVFLDGPLDTHPGEWDPPCAESFESAPRQAYLADTVAAMDEAGVDAIVYPTWTNPPARIDRGYEDYEGDNSQLVAPDTGLPAVTVPMGYTCADLPAGLQILGRPHSEGLLFGLAYAYEQATMHRRPPAGFPEL